MNKKHLSIIISIVLFLSTISVFPDTGKAISNSDFTVFSVCLMDADTGQVLFQINNKTAAKPASTTKLITCLLAMANNKTSGTYTMSNDAVWTVPRDASHCALDVGEVVEIHDMMYGMMLQSNNDCANAVAEYTAGGTLEDFVKMANEKCTEIGCVNTNFVNANGLEDENHYTCAYDLALIAKECLKYPDFIGYCNIAQYDMGPTNLQSEQRHFIAHNYMMMDGKYYYEYVIAGKTGKTTAAKNTLVEIATKEGRTLIAVALTGEEIDDTVGACRTLFEYGFNEFEDISLSLDGYKESLNFLVNTGITQENISFEPGEKTINNEGYIEVPVTITVNSDTATMEKDLGTYTFTSIEQVAAPKNEEEKGILATIWSIIVKILVYLVIGFVLACIYFRIRRNIRRKMARRAARRMNNYTRR